MYTLFYAKLYSYGTKYYITTRCVALGEVGLDYHYHPHAREINAQKRYLRRAVDVAVEIKKPIVIHSRDKDGSKEAIQACQDIMCATIPRDYPVYVHCFVGTPEDVDSWKKVSRRTIFGINHLLLRPSVHDVVATALRQMRLDDIMLEMDVTLGFQVIFS